MFPNKTLQSINKEKDIIIVCDGTYAYIIDECLSALGYRVLGYADNSKSKQGTTVHKRIIMSVDEATRKYPRAQFIISNEIHSRSICEQLNILEGVDSSRIIVMDLYTILELKHLFPNKWVCEEHGLICHDPKQRSVQTSLSNLRSWVKSKAYQLKFKNIQLKKKKYYSSLCTIFKNEAAYLDEWIKYYKAVGVDHIYLYNNNSKDSYLEILIPYINEGYITLTDWPYAQGQFSAYRDCITKNGEITNWIGFIDMDEFVAPLKYANINETLSQFEKYSSIWIPELVYGSSALNERDMSEGVINTFIYSWPKHSNVGKCFLNTEYEVAEDMCPFFHHYIWAKKDGKLYPSVNVFGQVCFPDYFRCKNESFPMDLKHYVIKSKAEYQNKITGTDVTFKINPHTENAFVFHDIRSTKINYAMVDFTKKLNL